MTRMTLRRDDVVVGVDTHKDEHAAVVLDGLGGQIAELVVSATTGGFAHLLTVATGHVGPHGRVVGFGVEGTGSYGIGLARFLRRRGHQVHEVNRPPRKGERRLTGKSDLLDAEHAAREVLAGAKLATPKTADGSVESLRLLKIARDTAVKARSAAITALKATLVTAADELRAQLEPLTDHKLIHACAALDCAPTLAAPPGPAPPRAAPDTAMPHVLASRARRWLQLDDEITVHSRHLKTLTRAAAPQLLELVGIGFDIAAEMLVTAGDNPDRVRSEAAFAKMCGACPIPAGSGRTNGRHRLYRGGNRQANAALYRAVIVRMRWHQPTIDYVTR